MIAAILVGYAAYGLWLARRMGWCDGEYGLLPAGAAVQQARYQQEFGVAPALVGGVARLPFRLPGAYWVYAWARYVPLERQRALGRGVSLALSLPGVTLTLIWAQELGGPAAAVGVGLVLLSSATLVGSYATASYEGLQATLWLGGLYAAWHGLPLLAVLCGSALALLRASALPQAFALLVLSSSGWAYLAAAGIGWYLGGHPEVVAANGWVRLIRREHAVPFIPRDGWAYGLRVLAQRYEPVAGWLALAGIGHALPAPCGTLLTVTAGTLVAAHAPRALIRPKWVVGYLPDFALPVVLVLAVALAPALADPAWWWAAGVVTAWGLLRRRHPALA